MSRRRPYIPQRRRIFLGCEGRSEHGYATLLARMAREHGGIHVHIHVEQLQPGAGDPVALVARAEQMIAQSERVRERFEIKAILLDRADARINAAAEARGVQIGIQHMIWQAPDHEALLLHHLPGCQNLQPPAGASMAALRRHWADYEKGRTAQQLGERIAIEQIRQACAVEERLRTFLTAVGLI